MKLLITGGAFGSPTVSQFTAIADSLTVHRDRRQCRDTPRYANSLTADSIRRQCHSGPRSPTVSQRTAIADNVVTHLDTPTVSQRTRYADNATAHLDTPTVSWQATIQSVTVGKPMRPPRGRFPKGTHTAGIVTDCFLHSKMLSAAQEQIKKHYICINKKRLVTKKYKMSHTKIIYHVVFRTYRSIESIVESNEKELYNHIYSFCKSNSCLLYRIGGMPDHIHMLVEVPGTIPISTFVQRVKISSSNFIKENSHLFPIFQGWGKGYCAISYCQQEVPVIINYIKNQKSHHKIVPFVSELKNILDSSGTKYDERYILED